MLPREAQLAAATVYAQRVAVLRRLLGATAVQAYDELSDYGQTELDAYLDRLVPLSLAAQKALATNLGGYLRAVSGDEEDEPLDLDDVTGDAIREDGLRRHWSIPWFAMWGALGAGVALAEAVADTRALFRTQAEMDLALAQAATMARLAPQFGLVGYRRVLVGDGCKFCTEASGQLYRASELMPLHAGCNCSVAPIFGAVDPATSLNAATMEEG